MYQEHEGISYSQDQIHPWKTKGTVTPNLFIVYDGLGRSFQCSPLRHVVDVVRDLRYVWILAPPSKLSLSDGKN